MVVATNSPATHSIAELITDFYKTTGNVPPPLIGATSTLVHQHVYVFGGRLQSTRQISNRVYILSLKTKVWKTVQPQNTPPTPRYFHSADYHEQKNQILIYGGMGVKKTSRAAVAAGGGAEELVALDDLVFLNIQTMRWEYNASPNTVSIPSPRYAHVSSLIRNKLIVIGGQDVNNQYLQDIHIFDIKKRSWCAPLSSRQHQYGAYRSAAVAVTPIELTPPFAPTLDLLSDAFEETQSAAEEVADISIHVYSNFSGSEATRYLHTWKINNQLECVEMQDQSESISVGTVSPPALRFPTAFMCGQQFILAGPHFTPTSQQFQIWALDTNTFVWTKIEAGHALSRGSWLKGMLCQDSNRFIVFGHPERSMQMDYKDRVNCFEHMACVDIEIFGIYRPPRSTYSGFGQGLGLTLLKDPVLADLNIVTIDQQHIAVNSAVLAQRWPILRPLLSSVLMPQADSSSLVLDFEKRELYFPDTYVVLIAFLQFIYTDHLVTAQQHQPHILARLLFIADLFELPRLKALATHALHQMLNIQTATMIYESASLSNAVSLQIRALRVMINAKKMMQRQKMLEMNNRQQQQQLPKKQPEIPQTERPFSPPPTPASSNSIFSLPQQQQQQSANSSRFLQKYDLNRQQRQQQSLPSTPMSAMSSFSSSSQTSSHHHRSPSQRSLSTESHSAPAIPTTSTFSSTIIPTTNKQAIKLPNFRMRQASSTSQSSDGEYSPLSSAASSPKITPSSSFTVNHKSSSTSRSATSFWRQTTSSSGTTSLKKKSTTPSKSESTTRMPAFNFIK
ncbi:RNA polymerase II transcription factor B 52 kDa subunit [Mucor velutinosus]|uniref:RNA polymerase II transcription factor B 52 kDa subunit n=1 Tax=Mucor velutinosus TaxID=708070 RepID=A0AAN7I3M9_9FUNG|nr:RNA polymerase II transcription factor B 52 kDa subunit [Mucor velutinosus]